jgi:hypothetical protein
MVGQGQRPAGQRVPGQIRRSLTVVWRYDDDADPIGRVLTPLDL